MDGPFLQISCLVYCYFFTFACLMDFIWPAGSCLWGGSRHLCCHSHHGCGSHHCPNHVCEIHLMTMKWNEGIGPPLGCHSALLFMLRDQSGAGGSNCKPSITSPSWLTWPPWPRPWHMTMNKPYHHQHPRLDYYDHPDHHCQIDHQSKHDHHVRHWRQIHWQITFTKVIHDIIS